MQARQAEGDTVQARQAEGDTVQMLDPLLTWFAAAARPLPWREPRVTAWGVLVSEVMLQQTPVPRVLPVWTQWLARWPDPPSLASARVGEAVRAWGRLGYPRRALRLHEAADACVRRHGGEVPARLEQLRALPGVGAYTAAAVAAFAFRQRVPVIDTNVARTLARWRHGVAAPSPAVRQRDREELAALLPEESASAARASAALMELGALVCRPQPKCDECPLAPTCAWRASGWPGLGTRVSRAQTYAGTDRQARGAVLAMLREAPNPVPEPRVLADWPDADQRERAIASLLADRLVARTGGALHLPD